MYYNSSHYITVALVLVEPVWVKVRNKRKQFWSPIVRKYCIFVGLSGHLDEIELTPVDIRDSSYTESTVYKIKCQLKLSRMQNLRRVRTVLLKYSCSDK